MAEKKLKLFLNCRVKNSFPCIEFIHTLAKDHFPEQQTKHHKIKWLFVTKTFDRIYQDKLLLYQGPGSLEFFPPFDFKDCCSKLSQQCRATEFTKLLSEEQVR